MNNQFKGLTKYLDKMDTLNDTKVYVGVTPETDQRNDRMVGDYSVSEISRYGFGEEPAQSNAQLVMQNITGGKEFEFYPFDLIYSTDVIPQDGIIENMHTMNPEFGSISQRDFIRPVFRNAFKDISKELKLVARLKSRNQNYFTNLQRLGDDIKQRIVYYARHNTWDANPESYSMLKNGKPPLQLSGQMLESITSKIKE